MHYQIHPLTLTLIRTWIYDDETRSCCRIAVKLGWKGPTYNSIHAMSPGQAKEELTATQNTLYKMGCWPLWLFLLCCGAYVLMAIPLVSFLISR